jgi:hypothetical protein
MGIQGLRIEIPKSIVEAKTNSDTSGILAH